MMPHAAGWAIAPASAFYGLERKVRGRLSGGSAIGPARTAFYRSIWKKAADETGAEFRDLDGRLFDVVAGDLRVRVCDSLTSLDDPVTLDVAGDKELSYRLMEAQGVPVPRHLVCQARDLAAAAGFLRDADGPCVVKPATNTASGHGVTSGVTTPAALFAALARAAAFCPEVVVEQQLRGDDLRLLYLDGRLLDAVVRRPPHVTGDGRSSLRKLVALENERRVRSVFTASHSLLHVDDEMRRVVRGQGYDLRAIPGRGARLRLKDVVSENRGDENEAALEAVCPAVVEAGASAGSALGLRLAGVDVITPDAGVPLSDSGGAVIEVNTTPSLYYHYAKSPAPTPVARLVLEALIGERRVAS